MFIIININRIHVLLINCHPIFKIIDKYELIKYHSYADDLQLYIESSSENDCTSVKLLNECINEITEWFNSNSLKINPEKNKNYIY